MRPTWFAPGCRRSEGRPPLRILLIASDQSGGTAFLVPSHDTRLDAPTTQVRHGTAGAAQDIGFQYTLISQMLIDQKANSLSRCTAPARNLSTLRICAIALFMCRAKNGTNRIERARKRVKLTETHRRIQIEGSDTFPFTASPPACGPRHPRVDDPVRPESGRDRCRRRTDPVQPQSAPRPARPGGTPRRSSVRPAC